MTFSVITPSYNQGKYLERTIRSVISQKGFFTIEYIVMDGGSRDESIKVLRKFEKLLSENPRIKFSWISRPDNGQADAINKGLEKISGDVVSYINSDDYYLPGAFERVRKTFNRDPEKKWVVGNCQVSDPKLRWTFSLKHIWPVHIFKSALFVFNTINQPSVFLHKSLVKNVGGFDTTLKYAFDYDYWLRCLKYGKPGRVYATLSVFRIHKESKGNLGFIKQFNEDIEVVRKYTNNPLILWIHRLGKFIVELSYTRIKK